MPSKSVSRRRLPPATTTPAPTMLDTLLASAIADRSTDERVKSWLMKLKNEGSEDVQKSEKPKAA